MSLEKACAVFAERFAHWGIEIDRKALAGGGGLIQKAGWTIRFLTGSENGEPYLEYYATHRMTDDTHVRIWASGKTDELEAIAAMYMFKSEVPGDEERARAEYLAYNRRVAAELEAKGLYPVGDINAYLRTGGSPTHAGEGQA